MSAEKKALSPREEALIRRVADLSGERIELQRQLSWVEVERRTRVAEMGCAQMREERDAALAREAALREALEVYASPGSWVVRPDAEGIGWPGGGEDWHCWDGEVVDEKANAWSLAREALAAPSPVTDLLERVRAEEREACARVADSWFRFERSYEHEGAMRSCKDIAAAIRARGEVGGNG